jgi:hypothetical protein
MNLSLKLVVFYWAYWCYGWKGFGNAGVCEEVVMWVWTIILLSPFMFPFYAWNLNTRPFYGAHIDRIDRVQRKFVRYALRGLGWTDMCDLPTYVDRCTLIRLKTLAERSANTCVMFIFVILSGRVKSSNLLSLISINAPWYHTRAGDFLRVDFHRTNYGVHEPLNGAVRSFNEFAGLFDLHLSRNQFFNRLRSVL